MADEVPAASLEEAAVAALGDPKKATIDVKVYAPFKVYYEGKGYSVSAVNETGPFDILPRHHNFLCMLVPGSLIIETPDGRKIIKVSRALMHVKADSVVVFMDV
jgi:F0F1-type ATP synthase epsilon subunit